MKLLREFSFSTPSMRPVRVPIAIPDSSGSLARRCAQSFTEARDASEVSLSMLGHTTNTRPPPAISWAARRHRACTQACLSQGTRWVVTWVRPAGSPSKTEISRSPKTVIATVRGMGVAVITSRCGVVRAPLGSSEPRSRSTLRWATPKRCCSSITTRPKPGSWTVSESRAWVPTTMALSPLASLASTARLAGTLIEAVNK